MWKARCIALIGAFAVAVLAWSGLAARAGAHVQHTVEAGETLWSVAADNGVSVDALASENGLAADAQLIAGEGIAVPPAAAVPPEPPPLTEDVAAAQGMVPIHHPTTIAYLAPEAAAAWEAMRQESLRRFGVDLYPIGPRSGYRTYEQQAYFYELYRLGLGPPANPPGASSHETGTAIDLAAPEMREVIDQIGAAYGWAKVEAPGEWWHLNYVGR